MIWEHLKRKKAPKSSTSLIQFVKTGQLGPQPHTANFVVFNNSLQDFPNRESKRELKETEKYYQQQRLNENMFPLAHMHKMM